MKKALILLICFLSIIAFSQERHPSISIQPITPNSFKGFHGFMKDTRLIIHGTRAEKYSGQGFRDPQSHESRSLVQLFDSIYYWAWDKLVDGWQYDEKYINIVYDANNNLISEMQQIWEEGVFKNCNQLYYNYDANNRFTGELWQRWSPGGFENYEQTVVSYNDNGLPESELIQFWYENLWGTAFQSLYTYDAKGNLLNELMQQWIGSTCVNYYQYTYTYDSNNNQTSELLQGWEYNAWQNLQRYIRTFDASNNLIIVLDQYWNYSDWADNTKTNYSYAENNNLIEEIMQMPDNDGWENHKKHSYLYDLRNNLINNLEQFWLGQYWVSIGQHNYKYDADNFQISDTEKRRNYPDSLEITGDSTHYYFHTALGINDLAVISEFVTVYPNPGSGKFTLVSEHNINSIEVYNLPGELIYHSGILNRKKTAELDLSGQTGGTYFIKIYSGDIIYTSKIIVR